MLSAGLRPGFGHFWCQFTSKCSSVLQPSAATCADHVIKQTHPLGSLEGCLAVPGSCWATDRLTIQCLWLLFHNTLLLQIWPVGQPIPNSTASRAPRPSKHLPPAPLASSCSNTSRSFQDHSLCNIRLPRCSSTFHSFREASLSWLRLSIVLPF